VVNYHRRVSEVNAIGSQVTCALRASVERAKQGVRAVEEVIKAVKRSQDLEIEEVNALLDEDVADTLDDIEYTDEPQTVESVDADAPTMPRTRTPDGMDRIMDRFAVPSTK
jgi:hypothetical protein